MRKFMPALLMFLGVLAINWIHNQPPFFWDYFWIYLIGFAIGEITGLVWGKI